MTNQYKDLNRAYIARRAMFWRIRDSYLSASLEREAILESSPPPPDGQPGGGSRGDPTLDKAARLAELDRFVVGVDAARAEIPEEYREAVWRHVLYGTRWPFIAARSTWERQERRFLANCCARVNR